MDTFTIDQLHGDEKNPRVISKDEYEKLKKLLAKFGDLGGIIRNVRTDKLVGGHMRLKAFNETGGTVQITQRFDTPTRTGTVAIGYVIINGEQFSYREVDWEEPFQRAANIAANNAGGSNDLDLLAEVVYELSQMENGQELLDLTALMVDDINKLLDNIGANGEGNPEDDEAPEVDEINPPVSKLGEIYQLGNHRLMCGDSTSYETVQALMNGQKANMVLTDPPYGMFLDTDFSTIKGSMSSTDATHGTEGNKYDKVIGDHDDFTPELITTIFDNFETCAEVFLFGGDYFAELIPEKNEGSWCVWDKRKESQEDAIGAEFELIWSKAKHKRRMLRHDWFGFLSSQNTADARNRVHPTQKPITLLVDIMKQWGNRNDAVVDLYGGSGSTLIACQDMERSCYMMELDPRYCDVIRKRFAKHTEQQDWILATPVIQSAEDETATVEAIEEVPVAP